MYEQFFGLTEKPFSLTPDPKFLYRSASHANAFELLQYAIRRREGFVAVTGDIGTGKTTLCRALLEQIDRTTYTALVLNPFLTAEDLLKRILQDFGVVSRAEVRSGAFAGATKQDLVDMLYDFLVGLIAQNASAVLIIDEAQNLPLAALEQIRMLSNLETDKDKLLQIILVGQLNLQALLRSPQLRQLDQRISVRYELEPLDAEGVAAYIAHRLTIAGNAGSVSFTPRALQVVFRLSQGVPRLVNLICDRALVAAFSASSRRVTDDMVAHAAEGLDVQTLHSHGDWVPHVRSMGVAASAVLVGAFVAIAATTVMYRRSEAIAIEAGIVAPKALDGQPHTPDRTLPAHAALTIAAGSFPLARPTVAADVRALTESLESGGFHVYYAEVDNGRAGRWQRVLVGAYNNAEAARTDADRLKIFAPANEFRVVSAAAAGGAATAGLHE